MLACSDYEGRVTKDIRALRKERGLDKDQEWDIWRDGCEGGEYDDLRNRECFSIRC
jgi:probable phosphoglycerate mutase